jgi:hypothetical protein
MCQNEETKEGESYAQNTPEFFAGLRPCAAPARHWARGAHAIRFCHSSLRNPGLTLVAVPAFRQCGSSRSDTDVCEAKRVGSCLQYPRFRANLAGWPHLRYSRHLQRLLRSRREPCGHDASDSNHLAAAPLALSTVSLVMLTTVSITPSLGLASKRTAASGSRKAVPPTRANEHWHTGYANQSLCRNGLIHERLGLVMPAATDGERPIADLRLFTWTLGFVE